MVDFGEFLKTWSLRSNSVTREVNFNRTKIGGTYRNSNATFWVIFKQCKLRTGYVIVPYKCRESHPQSTITIEVVCTLYIKMSRFLGIIFLGLVVIVVGDNNATENSTTPSCPTCQDAFSHLGMVRTCTGRLELKFENDDDIMRWVKIKYLKKSLYRGNY